MSKNIVIVILAILCVGLFFYGLIQKIEAEKQAELAIAQTKIAMECASMMQQKDKELTNRNEQLMHALNEARIARDREQENLKKANELYEKTVKKAEQSRK